jgi:hypothetical protein
MFHYYIFVERRLLFAAYLRGSATPKAQPSAATRTSTNRHFAAFTSTRRVGTISAGEGCSML